MLTMTPGTYLRRRREAAGLSIDDLALRIDTFPPMCMSYRAELIAAIEADTAAISPGTAIALRMRFCFDPLVLDQLAAIHAGAPIAPPQLCRVCACSWHDPCRRDHSGGAPFGRCSWSHDDANLCTACVGAPAALAIAASADILNFAPYREAASARSGASA